MRIKVFFCKRLGFADPRVPCATAVVSCAEKWHFASSLWHHLEQAPVTCNLACNPDCGLQGLRSALRNLGRMCLQTAAAVAADACGCPETGLWLAGNERMERKWKLP